MKREHTAISHPTKRFQDMKVNHDLMLWYYKTVVLIAKLPTWDTLKRNPTKLFVSNIIKYCIYKSTTQHIYQSSSLNYINMILLERPFKKLGWKVTINHYLQQRLNICVCIRGVKPWSLHRLSQSHIMS